MTLVSPSSRGLGDVDSGSPGAAPILSTSAEPSHTRPSLVGASWAPGFKDPELLSLSAPLCQDKGHFRLLFCGTVLQDMGGFFFFFFLPQTNYNKIVRIAMMDTVRKGSRFS